MAPLCCAFAVDGCHVADVIRAAFGNGDDVVGFVGAWLAADVAGPVVAAEDERCALLLG